MSARRSAEPAEPTWENPPRDARVGVTDELVEALRAQPGRWALWRVVTGHSARRPLVPRDIEHRVRYVSREGARETRIYLRARGGP